MNSFNDIWMTIVTSLGRLFISAAFLIACIIIPVGLMLALVLSLCEILGTAGGIIVALVLLLVLGFLHGLIIIPTSIELEIDDNDDEH